MGAAENKHLMQRIFAKFAKGNPEPFLANIAEDIRWLGVSEDDIVVDVRYCLLYILREDILDLREAWVQRAIMERFQDYTHQNALRLYRIAVAHDDCLVFDLQLVDPDVAIQEIVDDISDVLNELLPWPHTPGVASPWREVRMLTIGAPKSAEEEITAYIEAVRRSQSNNDG